MTKRMLIDAAHPEETRVVIVDGTRVEELDFESRNKRQLRGNVYLAKVTRVEPSLQAAFIEYGGNRHGFLAFSEIHPDYYQLPYEDKLALQEQEAEELKDLEDDDDEDVEEDSNLDPDDDDATDENDAEIADEQVKVASKRRKRMNRRRYKIQEVIKRGQILLVQAVKEERGNKGAAMTTYLSLAGRYCVLMPNTPRGGGISRKIPNGADRKRLRTIVDGLDVPQGVGVIVRTAGAKRTKAEITRDYNYLSRLWDEIRDTTLKSVAPALIHEEGNLVKRSIRDLYNKEIEEVLVQGEDAYKTAKGFIKMLMPSHAKFVRRYDDEIPLFLRFNVETQIENSLNSVVQLKSGGYLVIHPTEALVSVDVNSGRSTKERNVERTALKTNLEAAEELARQMRLRDLAGLIVVDFIDMDENKNNRAVERKMKEALSRDRARIQTSRISQFGLMEMSRQRRRRSLLEGSTTICPHCSGVGRKRTVESAALAAIRAVEDFAIRGKASKIRLKCPPDVALYLLNEKRDLLTKVDEDTDVFTIVEHDDELIRPAFLLEVAEKRSDGRKDPLVEIEKELEKERKESERKASQAKKKSSKAKKQDDDQEDDAPDSEEKSEDQDGEEDSKPKRRRGRRGGRNRRKKSENQDVSTESDSDDKGEDKTDDKSSKSSQSSDDKKDEAAKSDKAKSAKSRSSSRRKAPSKAKTDDKDVDKTAPETNDAEKPASGSDKKRSTRRRKAPSKSSSEPASKSPTNSSAKSSKADQDESASDNDAKADGDTAKAGSSRRRKAPSRKPARAAKSAKSSATKSAKADDANDDANADKPKRRRKAPTAKTDKAESPASDAGVEAEPKSSRRRAAPKKTSQSDEDKVKATPKRRRAAPKRKAAADTTGKAESPSKTKTKPKAKPTKKAEPEGEEKTPSRRKAPTRKAAPAKKAAPKKAAPKKKAEASPKPKAETSEKAEAKATKTDTSPDTSSDDTPRRRKAPAKKKRGLIDRLMGKE